MQLRRLLQNRISYRIATVEDASAMAHFHGCTRSAGPTADYSVDAFAKRIESDVKCYLIATVKGKIVGSVTIERFPGNEELYPDWWIFILVVSRQHRGMGIGQNLLNLALQEAVVNNAAKVYLLVSDQNKAAINLYQKMGFQRASIPRLDAQLEEEAQMGKKRSIIMSISLGEGVRV
jgi:ribosomal protein S18 acetylase RimI-like enzyme